MITSLVGFQIKLDKHFKLCAEWGGRGMKIFREEGNLKYLFKSTK